MRFNAIDRYDADDENDTFPTIDRLNSRIATVFPVLKGALMKSAALFFVALSAFTPAGCTASHAQTPQTRPTGDQLVYGWVEVYPSEDNLIFYDEQEYRRHILHQVDREMLRLTKKGLEAYVVRLADGQFIIKRWPDYSDSYFTTK